MDSSKHGAYLLYCGEHGVDGGATALASKRDVVVCAHNFLGGRGEADYISVPFLCDRLREYKAYIPRLVIIRA